MEIEPTTRPGQGKSGNESLGAQVAPPYTEIVCVSEGRSPHKRVCEGVLSDCLGEEAVGQWWENGELHAIVAGNVDWTSLTKQVHPKQTNRGSHQPTRSGKAAPATRPTRGCVKGRPTSSGKAAPKSQPQKPICVKLTAKFSHRWFFLKLESEQGDAGIEELDPDWNAPPEQIIVSWIRDELWCWTPHRGVDDQNVINLANNPKPSNHTLVLASYFLGGRVDEVEETLKNFGFTTCRANVATRHPDEHVDPEYTRTPRR